MPLQAAGIVPPASVLIVDDHDDTRDLYATGLGAAGFDIRHAASAEEAIERLIDGMPDVIVADLSLPGMSGTALCRHARRLRSADDLKLVAVAGRACDPELAEAKGAGVDLVLVKPCLPRELAEAVRDLLERGARLRRRSRGVLSRAAGHADRSKRLHTQSRVLLLAGGISSVVVPCPACGTALGWRETNRVGGVRYDYFDPCEKGCGLYLFDHLRRRMVRLRG